MVDCPTEDVPFREGTFGGAGKWYPYLRPASLRSQCLVSPGSHLLSFSKSKTGPPLSRGVAGCATGSARPCERPDDAGRASRPLRFVPIVPFPGKP